MKNLKWIQICGVLLLSFLGGNHAVAQTASYSEVTLTDRLISGPSFRGLHLRRTFLSSAHPMTSTWNQGLLLWHGGRRSFYSGYYVESDITSELLQNEYAAGFGYRSVPKGTGAFAFGYMTVANSYSVAGGDSSEALGERSAAFGQSTRAEGTGSFAAGIQTKALGYTSVALGNHSEALGTDSFAVGGYVFASGFRSAAFGDNTDAVGWYSFTTGRITLASASSSSAHGLGTEALHSETFVVGRYNDGLSGASWSERPLFIVGNGSSNLNRSNALEVYENGEVRIQKIPPKGGISMGNFQ